MSKNVSSPESEEIASVRKAIFNALASAQILALLRPFGYDTSGLIEGRVLLETAAGKVEKSAAASRNATAAATFVEESWEDGLAAYNSLARIARVLFKKDKATLELLGLKGAAPRSQLDIRNSARKLFNTANYTPEVKLRFAKRGYSDGKLSLAKAKFAEYDHAREMQLREDSAAERALDEAEKSIGDLKEWTACFNQVARIALQKHAEFLQRLGLGGRSSSRKKFRRGGLGKIPSSRRRKRTA